MRKIISLSGLIGSGKDTVADHLVSKYNFKRLAFATKLKDLVAQLFDISRDGVEGLTVEAREWRDQPLDFWSKELDCDITPRYLLQQIGTECMRRGFYEDIWVAFVKKILIENPRDNFVITDTRFINEINMVKSLKGSSWQIKRGLDPVWWNDAVIWNTELWTHGWKTDLENPFANSSTVKGPWHNIHSTEWSLVGYDFDVVIDNNKSFEELFNQIDYQLK